MTAIAQVQTSAASIQGTLTASQPLPYSVPIGLPGKPGDVTLQPGQTSVSFNFSLAQLNAEEASRAVAGYALASWRGAALRGRPLVGVRTSILDDVSNFQPCNKLDIKLGSL